MHNAVRDARVAAAFCLEVPADAPRPQITAIRLVGDNVFLTVKNTLPCLRYAATEVKGSQPSTPNAQPSTQGAAALDDEITVIAPKAGASGLYSVGRD